MDGKMTFLVAIVYTLVVFIVGFIMGMAFHDCEGCGCDCSLDDPACDCCDCPGYTDDDERYGPS